MDQPGSGARPYFNVCQKSVRQTSVTTSERAALSSVGDKLIPHAVKRRLGVIAGCWTVCPSVSDCSSFSESPPPSSPATYQNSNVHPVITPRRRQWPSPFTSAVPVASMAAWPVSAVIYLPADRGLPLGNQDLRGHAPFCLLPFDTRARPLPGRLRHIRAQRFEGWGPCVLKVHAYLCTDLTVDQLMSYF